MDTSYSLNMRHTAMTNSKLQQISEDFLGYLSSTGDLQQLKIHPLHLGKYEANSIYDSFNLFYLLRDKLVIQGVHRRLVCENHDELLHICRQKVRKIYENERANALKEQKALAEKRAKEIELNRIERYNNYPFLPVIDDNNYYGCKVAEIKIINTTDVYGDWTTWHKIGMEAKRKVQELTLSTGDIFYVAFSVSAQGVKQFDIIDFTIERGTQRIVRGSIKGGENDTSSRPITVFNIDFTTHKSAYKALQPDYAYSTICNKTRHEVDQDKIDEAFKGHHSRSIYLQGLQVIGKRELKKRTVVTQ
jgi:hypothetical protein